MIEKIIKIILINANEINHQVSQKGELIIISIELPFSFHNPSLLEPKTLKVYLPGGKLVYVAIRCFESVIIHD